LIYVLQSSKSPFPGFLYAVLAEESRAFFKHSLHTNSISNSAILRNNYISLLRFKGSKFIPRGLTHIGIEITTANRHSTAETCTEYLFDSSPWVHYFGLFAITSVEGKQVILGVAKSKVIY